ncbi:dynein intermediate chain 2, ciliary-like [Cherax quadricarinatus]|uniref:dynein intermediate chain 2, ciliary-like n=1 Tax=Cherax quadricarinatus TaxID=27406 RepID=UPI00387EAE72
MRMRCYVSMNKNEGSREPEVAIRLTSTSCRVHNEVRYSFTANTYQRVWADDLVLDLLTLPSRTIHRDLYEQYFQSSKPSPQDECAEEAARLLEEVYVEMVGKEELARLDSQPNPFSFSERVSQTIRFNSRNLEMQTEPPPSTAFTMNVGPALIYDSYQKNYLKILEREREREREKEREREMERERERERANGKGKKVAAVAWDPLIVAAEPCKVTGEGWRALASGLVLAAKVVERMVNQNIYDDVSQDFRYWEDGSDEYRPLEGSLLPLWKFHHDKSRGLVVSHVRWSPVYSDLFAAAYTSGDLGGDDGTGMLCLYTLKNPSTPERVFRAPCGVTCVCFHPQHGSVVAAGWSDGTVVMYDIRSSTSPVAISSSATAGKHLLPVIQVEWVRTQPGEELCMYSVALDGRLTEWQVRASSLVHSDVLHFMAYENSSKPSIREKMLLEGISTCVAFRPDNEEVVLVGVDSGAVFQCSTHSTVHALTRYPAHTAAVRALVWNIHHHKVFISCSVDWTVKVWFQYHLSPLVVLDLGGAVAEVTWSPYSSSVFVAVTDEGRVHVYDLFLRKCRPLCVQSLVQRRRVSATCVAFNPFYPIILVGGEKGNLLSLKLSPNLRKVHKDAKGADDQKLKEIELCKMERLVATNKG